MKIYCSFEEHEYEYDGPVYLKNQEIDYKPLRTMASSDKKAINNFRYRISRSIGCAVPDIRLDKNYLRDLDAERTEEEEEDLSKKFCENCGLPLSDGGYCRLCDDNDEESVYGKD